MQGPVQTLRGGPPVLFCPQSDSDRMEPILWLFTLTDPRPPVPACPSRHADGRAVLRKNKNGALTDTGLLGLCPSSQAVLREDRAALTKQLIFDTRPFAVFRDLSPRLLPTRPSALRTEHCVVFGAANVWRWHSRAGSWLAKIQSCVACPSPWVLWCSRALAVAPLPWQYFLGPGLLRPTRGLAVHTVPDLLAGRALASDW